MLFALLVASSLGPPVSNKDPLVDRINLYEGKLVAVNAKLTEQLQAGKPPKEMAAFTTLKLQKFFLEDRIVELKNFQRRRRAGQVTEAEVRDRLLKDALDLPM